MHFHAPPAFERLRYELSRLQTSPQFAAIIDYLFDIQPRRVAPVLAELVVVDGSLLFARPLGEPCAGLFVGRRDEVERELIGFTRHLHLTDGEQDYVRACLAALPYDGIAPRT